MAATVICKFNQYGYCRYKETCRKQHINENCENSSCDWKTCKLRHPKSCKFLREYGFCKFGEWCRFFHFEKENFMDKFKRENDVILKKLSEIDKKIEVLHQHEDEIITKREFDDKISKLEQIIAEQGDRIDTLENQISEKSNVLEEKVREIEKKIEESITNNLNDEKSNTMERRIYILEKRRLGSDFCDYCEFEFKAGCEKDRRELDIHIRNTHTFECNICDLRLKNKEELELHHQTCEMYQCSLCTYRHKRLSELKSHCKNKHTKNTIIRHRKMDRENFSKVSSKNYFSEEV